MFPAPGPPGGLGAHLGRFAAELARALAPARTAQRPYPRPARPLPTPQGVRTVNDATNGATAPAPAPSPLDTGRPIAISPRYWAGPDGTRTGHNGLSAFERAPADEVQALLVRREYHRAKLDLAWGTLRGVRAALTHGAEFRWDVTHLGPVPFAPTATGPEPDLAAADRHLSSVCRHHEGEFKRLDAELRARGVNPDFLLVG